MRTPKRQPLAKEIYCKTNGRELTLEEFQDKVDEAIKTRGFTELVLQAEIAGDHVKLFTISLASLSKQNRIKANIVLNLLKQRGVRVLSSRNHNGSGKKAKKKRKETELRVNIDDTPSNITVLREQPRGARVE